MRSAFVLLLSAAMLAACAADPAAAPLHAPSAADELRANTIVGLVRLCADLDARGVAEPRVFDAAERDALIAGMPARIRPFLSRIDGDGHAIDVVATEIRPHPTLAGRRQLVVGFAETWIAPLGRRGRFGGARSKGHVGDVWLSRAREVRATINPSGIADPRCAGACPYADCRQQRGILSEEATGETLAAHPWSVAGQKRPLGLEDVTGLTLQVRISGWWKDATDIQPVSHLFVYADQPAAHIWLGYKELIGHVDRDAQRFQCTNAAFDSGLPESAAFPDYLGLAPTPRDTFSVSDLTAEGG